MSVEFYPIMGVKPKNQVDFSVFDLTLRYFCGIINIKHRG